MDAIALKANDGSSGAPASRERCPLLAKGSHANREFCTATGFVTTKNERACRANNCTSPWRICWACAMEIPTPSAAYATVVNNKVGLCAYHEKHGHGAVKPRSNGGDQEERPRIAPPSRNENGRVEAKKEVLKPAASAAVSNPPSSLVFPSVALPAVTSGAPMPQEKVHDGEVLPPEDPILKRASPRLQKIRELLEKYSNTPPINIPLEKVVPDPDQPRTYFNKAKMMGLTASIREVGQTDPGLVVLIDGGFYRIVDGERRLRACLGAGTGYYRAWVCEPAEAGILYGMSVMKNFNRAEQTTMEKARSVKRLRDEFQFTQHEVADLIGEDDLYVSYYMRFNDLCDEVVALMDEDLDEGQRIVPGAAREIAKLPKERQLAAAQRVIREKLSVVKTTQLVRAIANDEGLTLRTRRLRPADKWKVMNGRFERAHETLSFYEGAHPSDYADVLRTRSRVEKEEVRKTLLRIMESAKALYDAIK